MTKPLPAHLKPCPVMKKIYNRLHKFNKNTNVVFDGENASGKSWAALYLCSQIDPNFSEDNIVFTGLDFIKFVRNAKKGQAVLVDEAALQVNSREFYKEGNRIWAKVAESFRRKNLMTVYTLTSMHRLDSHLRDLTHARCEMLYVDFEKKRSVGNFTWRKYSARFNDTFTIYPRGKEEGTWYRYNLVSFPKPVYPELIKAYEDKKKSILDRGEDDFIAKLESVNADGSNKKIHLKLIYDKVVKDLPKYLNEKGLVDTATFKVHLNLSQLNAHALKKVINAEIKAGKLKA